MKGSSEEVAALVAARAAGAKFRSSVAALPFGSSPAFVVCESRAWYYDPHGQAREISSKWGKILRTLLEEFSTTAKPPGVNDKTERGFTNAAGIRCTAKDNAPYLTQPICPACAERIRATQLGQRVTAELGSR